jgi:hypothetical protein
MPGGIGQVEDGVARVAELNAAVLGGQKAAAPEAVVGRLVNGASADEGGENDVGGQVLVFTAEAVAEPMSRLKWTRSAAVVMMGASNRTVKAT